MNKLKDPNTVKLTFVSSFDKTKFEQNPKHFIKEAKKVFSDEMKRFVKDHKYNLTTGIRISMKITEKEAELLGVIREFEKNHDGLSPTYEEIAIRLGVSKQLIAKRIGKLIKKGFVSKIDNKFRTIQIIKQS